MWWELSRVGIVPGKPEPDSQNTRNCQLGWPVLSVRIVLANLASDLFSVWADKLYNYTKKNLQGPPPISTRTPRPRPDRPLRCPTWLPTCTGTLDPAFRATIAIICCIGRHGKCICVRLVWWGILCAARASAAMAAPKCVILLPRRLLRSPSC